MIEFSSDGWEAPDEEWDRRFKEQRQDREDEVHPRPRED